jgi:transcriptional regulator of heat shock response
VLVTMLGREEARLDRLLAEALRVGLAVCTAAAMDPLRVSVAGQSSLPLAWGEAGHARLAEVLALLEDYSALAEILCQLLPESEDHAAPRVEVCVGAMTERALVAPDSAWPPTALPGLALVGCRLPRGGARGDAKQATEGALALLGPARMDYESAIPMIEYAARALASRLPV